MDPVTVFADFYSPRWGHADRYEFEFSMEHLTIKQLARVCAATWHDNIDPEWGGESLTDILGNDSIYSPHNLESLLEHLWRAWRDGELNNAQLQAELTAFADYINASTAAKPQTEFWTRTF